MSSATRPTSKAVLAVGLLAVLAYAPALANGFVWDDRELIVDNPVLHADHPVIDAFRHDFLGSYYRPLVTLTYLADHAISGDSPFGYHLTNLLLHAAASIALLFAARRFGASDRVALAGAILFAIHPVHLESVAWIAGRTDTLCTALLLFALAARAPLSWLLGAAALLSKETAIIWPALAALRDAYAAPRAESSWRARGPELLIVVAVLVARRAVLGSFAAGFHPDLGEAAVGTFHLVGLFAAPWLAPVVYVIPLSIAPLLPAAGVGLALVAGGAVAARRRPTMRPWLAAAGIAFVPSIAALASAHILAPRLLYLPSAFLCVAAADLLLAAVAARDNRKWVARGAAVVAVVALMASTAWGSRVWRDDLTFWRRAAADDPRPDVLVKLAILQHDAGDLAAAWSTLDRRPDRSLPQTHYMRGLLLSELGCRDRAIAEYRQALAQKPDYSVAAGNLRLLESRPAAACPADVPAALADPAVLNAAALARAREGEILHAQSLVAAALRLRPSWPEALYTKAQLHYMAKDFPAAITTAEALLRADPSYTRVYKVLGLSQAKTGSPAARDSLTRYLTAYPTAPDAAELRAVIERL